MWRLVGVARHGQACAGTVDNTVNSGEITEATDDVHCRAAYFRFTVGKIPIRIDANGRSGACDAAAYYHPFQRRIGRMRDFFRKSLELLSQIRKTKGLAGKESRLEVYVSEELSLRVREENPTTKAAERSSCRFIVAT